MKWKVALTILVLAVCGGSANCAQDDATSAISKVYSSYRIALSYLRSGEIELGGISLATFIAGWNSLDKKLAAHPPAPFDRDSQFTATLEDVSKHAKDGQERLTEGNASEAVAKLEPIRSILRQLRRRNGVRTLSDCIDDISEQMDRLQALRDTKFDGQDQQQLNAASEVLGNFPPVLQACKQQAPETNQDQYKRLIEQASSSVESAKDALATHDTARFIRIVRELRSIDHILFQQFG